MLEAIQGLDGAALLAIQSIRTPVLDSLGIPKCSLLEPPINFTLC